MRTNLEFVMDNQQTKILAERIALLLQENKPESDDSTFLRLNLEKINSRLDHIESQISFQNTNRQTADGRRQSLHSSQEKFAIAEAISNDIIENLETEKACPYEPTGKPCDHCLMCSSRGF